ncbi:TORTIFOLIA1-like protein 2 [Phoenix dactylifera]|uniref:TORTIFOLIA1-like protein 2 n=1 Tax=Phoenix dactylifera TaxID=42345 RepID=A0A8B7C1C2_PHODC|nr:TORTIFOLIA1-like protein 2 [Phoenix dactylifera]XP_008789616.1 TORTIFOLIA1-like protein 2 [Phoenix dactylifera]
MKSNPSQVKARAGGRMVTSQQAVFELKHRLVLSLNKLADRDTHQIGVDELEKTAESLTPDMIPPFLSCITDTDSEQKSAVRKECVRVMANLARAHGSLLASHLPKMVASIVKRLKDTDSVVRDACVETCGVLATSIRSSGGGGGSTAFVALVRPLFEALGEQNRYVQAGAALCLARVIDEATDPPMSILPQMLARVVKLLKNPHFMAKPAIIELIRSIIQAGGASTEHALSVALTGILDALKSTDWTTRKAASVALAGIAVSAGALLGPFRSSCLRSLEGCRFDKVKPVRDAIMHAIQCWKTLPGAGSPEPSEAGSSTKENFSGDYHDVTSASDSGWRDTSFRKVGPVSVLSGNSTSSTKKRAPLSVRKACTNYVQNHQHIKSNDWHIEISFPKSRAMPLPGAEQKESGRHCIEKAFDRMAAHAAGEQDVKYGDPMDDKPECSSVSDLVSGSYETKHVAVAHECLEDGDSADLIGMNQKPTAEEIEPELLRTRERNSLDSTVTDFCSQTVHGCCLHAANELSFIRKQLLEIETKQSNLLDLLQVFMGNTLDNLSTLKFKVHNLEYAVDKISQGITRNENYSNMASSRLLKKNQSVSSSPRLSTCTPRPSTDSNYKQPSLLSMKNKEPWGENASLKSRSSTSVKDGVELWRDPALNTIRNPITKGIQKNSGGNAHSSVSSQARDAKDLHSVSASNDSAKQSNLEGMSGFWQRVKEFLIVGDAESAYVEALCSGDDLSLIELMDRTGPVLERLSCETASEVLSILTTHFLDQRFPDSTISWLQQVVDLSTAHEPRHLFMSPKAQMEFLLALQGLVAVGSSDQADRISISQLVAKLSLVWGGAPCRKMLPTRGLRGNKSAVASARG